ncbi:hypothetical protein BDR03DRAFT_975385 [Suillus americanus]|nr:hypothetical protein BDR03DRAFT_975385 [Suillus americanus]
MSATSLIIDDRDPSQAIELAISIAPTNSVASMTAASAKDLTVGLWGKEVKKSSPKITWRDGHTTILPAVYDDYNINVCAAVDIPIIKYLAECPVSTPDSKFATHISNQDIPTFELHDIIGSSLSQNRPVTLRGTGLYSNDKKLTLEYLDLHYAISPNRAVWIHDVRARALDHTNVTKAGLLNTFFESMDDPNSIQCVLDIPLAQVALPDSLRNLDHGIAHGWSETVYDVPISSKVHPENFTVKGWALVHHAGFLTYPHHDAEGTLTWVKMDVGIKFWVIFRPKDRHDDRKHLQDFAIRLGNFTENESWIRANCDAEVITLLPGDMLIMPPWQVHAVYTPVASFATGGHFYHYACMHLTELSRYCDVTVGDCLTNQNLYHALETLRRMIIAIPRLSPRITMFRRSLLALCIMVTQGKAYRAKKGHKSAVVDTETAPISLAIAQAISGHLGVTTRRPIPVLLYKGDQFDRGELITRKELDQVLSAFTSL